MNKYIAMAFRPLRIYNGTELWLLVDATQGATDRASPPVIVAFSSVRLATIRHGAAHGCQEESPAKLVAKQRSNPRILE